MGAATFMLVAFVIAIIVSATVSAVHPPSHIETIDPARVRTEAEFASPASMRMTVALPSLY